MTMASPGQYAKWPLPSTLKGLNQPQDSQSDAFSNQPQNRQRIVFTNQPLDRQSIAFSNQSQQDRQVLVRPNQLSDRYSVAFSNQASDHNSTAFSNRSQDRRSIAVPVQQVEEVSTNSVQVDAYSMADRSLYSERDPNSFSTGSMPMSRKNSSMGVSTVPINFRDHTNFSQTFMPNQNGVLQPEQRMSMAFISPSPQRASVGPLTMKRASAASTHDTLIPAVENRFPSERPPDFLILATASMCCNCVLGIVAVVYAVMSRNSADHDDLQAAGIYGQRAAMFSLVGIVLSIVICAFYISLAYVAYNAQ